MIVTIIRFNALRALNGCKYFVRVSHKGLGEGGSPHLVGVGHCKIKGLRELRDLIPMSYIK